MLVYIYIYISVCVRVSVCVCVYVESLHKTYVFVYLSSVCSHRAW